MTSHPQPPPGPDVPAVGRRRVAGWVRWLPPLTLTAVLTITASNEFALARTVLALPPAVAWALPVAVDTYVLAALRSGRDVFPAMAVMAGALAAATTAHLAGTSVAAGRPLPTTVVAPAATAIMTVLVIVAWRVHVLIDHTHPTTPPVTTITSTVTTSPSVAPAADPLAPVLAPPLGVLAPPADTPTVPASTARPPRTLASDTPHAPHPPSTPSTDTPTDLERLPAGTRPAAAPSGPTHAISTTTTAPHQGNPSDSDILAAITGEPPSIRTLMRTHGIGQTRATRIHYTATQNNQKRTDHTQNRTQNQQDRNGSGETAEINSEEYQDQDRESEEQGTSKAEDQSHPCITDRVGQPRSVAGDADPNRTDFQGRLHVVGED